LLPGAAGLASGLLGLPVAGLGRRELLARRLLRRAERLEGRLGGGLGASRIAERRSGHLLAPPVRGLDEPPCPRPKRVVLLLVLGLERQAADLRLELADDVGHAREVVERLRQPPRRLVALHLEPL